MGRWIDISMPVTDGLRTNHSRPGEEVRITCDVKPDDTAQRKTVRRISTRLHIGTHADGPEHLVEGARRLDEYPVDRFTGPALVGDFHDKAPKGVIGPADLDRVFGAELARGDIAILRTGWNSRYAEPDFFDGSPCFAYEAADWFIRRGVSMVMVDFLFDPIAPELLSHGPDQVKTRLLANEVLVITNADNLDRIGKPRVTLYAFPIRIVPSEAAPVRAVVWED